ncbi:hypothetical protein DVH05_014079 [Phytophthora capsici]|nr:hypothetical protein DVH05_014079 [Phytophthora capsici]
MELVTPTECHLGWELWREQSQAARTAAARTAALAPCSQHDQNQHAAGSDRHGTSRQLVPDGMKNQAEWRERRHIRGSLPAKTDPAASKRSKPDRVSHHHHRRRRRHALACQAGGKPEIRIRILCADVVNGPSRRCLHTDYSEPKLFVHGKSLEHEREHFAVSEVLRAAGAQHA